MHVIIFIKEGLQKLADELNIEIRIAHYPPYTSKYNPIEHRLFPHITKACQGVIFKTVELVNDLIAKTKTSTGLRVVTNILDKTFETGRKVASDFRKTCGFNLMGTYHNGTMWLFHIMG